VSKWLCRDCDWKTQGLANTACPLCCGYTTRRAALTKWRAKPTRKRAPARTTA
jgi:hypothetical protein